jgi:divalent metal cation (Fe/Co/Zn/Cd) transporter
MRLIRALLSTTAYIVVSVIMVFAGVVLDVLAWMGKIAPEEPQLVLHLSIWALIFAGYGNVIIAIVNKRVKDNGQTST